MGLDSLELLVEIEKHFSISISDKDAEKAFTVGKLVDTVAKILNIAKYDFTLRDETFDSIKSIVRSYKINSPEFSQIDKVVSTIDIADSHLLALIEGNLNLKLPGTDINLNRSNGVMNRIQKWFQFSEVPNFETISWKRYIDIVLAFNLTNLRPPIKYKSKYEIYIAIMRITVDKIGVSYSEIGIEKSFTDDLGVD